MTDFLQKFLMKNKNVLVTGGCGILGKNFSKIFAEAGAQVIVLDYSDDTQSIASEIAFDSHNGGKIIGLKADLSNFDELASIIEGLHDTYGPMSHLLNNAASKSSDVKKFMRGPNDFDMETWSEVMRVNLDAGFYLSQLVANQMQQDKVHGSITFVSSIYGVVAPNPDLYEGSFYMGQQINTPPIYSATKSGVVGLSRYLAAYWGEHGIRVNCITPGGIESGQNEVFQQRYGARVPLKRMGTVEELAGGALFLASDAASYISGHNLIIDGGFTSW